MPILTTIAEFQTLDWVNEYTKTAIPVDDVLFAPILHFSLMWNLFERDACGKEANPINIQKSVQSAFTDRKLTLGAFKEHLDYFKNQAQLMTVDDYLDSLKLTHVQARNHVQATLIGTLNDANNVVYALLLIAHRVRNNLFHGEKEVALLHTQVDLFRTVNSLLATYLLMTRKAA